ncbi:MAG: FkbM family methyltransferase [Bacteroidota bacterium]
MLKDQVKNIYKLLPFKKQLFSTVKLFWKPSEPVLKHLHFTGTFKVNLDDQHSFRINHFGFQIENEIFWKGIRGGWEKLSMDIWIRLCADSSIVFDIGANTGVFALIAKSMNPKAEVFAFEPVQRVCDKLRKNIALNNYDIVAIDSAVSDKNGKAIIYDTPTDHILSVTVNKNLAPEDTTVIKTEIKTLTLNSFIKERNIGKIDLMKIDVETHEPEVLQGFSDYLSQYRPTMLIEILNDEVGAAVQRIVDGLGYLYFYIDEDNGVRQMAKVTRQHHYNYLFCSPDVAKQLGFPVNF